MVQPLKRRIVTSLNRLTLQPATLQRCAQARARVSSNFVMTNRFNYRARLRYAACAPDDERSAISTDVAVQLTVENSIRERVKNKMEPEANQKTKLEGDICI